MKETEQTLLEKCKDAIAYKEGYENWTECRFKVNSTSILLLMDQVAEMYATAKAQASCEATLKKAAENAKHIIVPPYTLDKSSITDPSSITIV